MKCRHLIHMLRFDNTIGAIGFSTLLLTSDVFFFLLMLNWKQANAIPALSFTLFIYLFLNSGFWSFCFLLIFSTWKLGWKVISYVNCNKCHFQEQSGLWCPLGDMKIFGGFDENGNHVIVGRCQVVCLNRCIWTKSNRCQVFMIAPRA